VISAYGWKNIAIVHVNDDYANNYARGMRDNSPPLNVSVVTTISYTQNDPTTYGPACASLAASGVNIIVSVMWDVSTQRLESWTRLAPLL
jgi:hypothetical protein